MSTILINEVREVIKRLQWSFDWEASAQGYEYWLAVKQNLEQVIESAPIAQGFGIQGWDLT